MFDIYFDSEIESGFLRRYVLSYYRLVLDFKRTASGFYKLANRVFKISHHFHTHATQTTFKSSSLHLFP